MRDKCDRNSNNDNVIDNTNNKVTLQHTNHINHTQFHINTLGPDINNMLQSTIPIHDYQQ